MSASGQAHAKQPIGIAAFDTLRAEDEMWLHECFVPPADFDLMARDCSIIVFGEAGAGKTALRQELIRRSSHNGKPTRLIVDWRPMPLEAGVAADLSAVRAQIAQIFDLCAWELLNRLARDPDGWVAVPASARATLVWFVQRFLQGDLKTRVGGLLEGNTAAGQAILQWMMANHINDVLSPSASPDYIAAELVKALQPIGLDGVWIVADNLEPWIEAEPTRLTDGLKSFLSTLPLFERAKFAYKLFLPQHLEAVLATATGIQRKRLDCYYLRWRASDLQSLVERRLALATGNAQFTLARLCEASAPPPESKASDRQDHKKPPAKKKVGLLEWLEIVGGSNPREWLDQVRPLAQYYLANRLTKPIDEKTWREIRQKRPPRFYLDESNRRIVVGGRQISLEKVPGKAFDMLTFLSRRGNRVVTKAELYYLAYRGLEKVPRTTYDKDYAAPKEYEGLIDTNLWRLRQAIEPDPSEPVLLVTVKGHGVQLNVRW